MVPGSRSSATGGTVSGTTVTCLETGAAECIDPKHSYVITCPPRTDVSRSPISDTTGRFVNDIPSSPVSIQLLPGSTYTPCRSTVSSRSPVSVMTGLTDWGYFVTSTVLSSGAWTLPDASVHL